MAKSGWKEIIGQSRESSKKVSRDCRSGQGLKRISVQSWRDELIFPGFYIEANFLYGF